MNSTDLNALVVVGLSLHNELGFRSYEDSSEEAVKVCQILLEEPDIDSSVRLGDLYGFMVEHYHKKGNYNMVSYLKVSVHFHLLLRN